MECMWIRRVHDCPWPPWPFVEYRLQQTLTSWPSAPFLLGVHCRLHFPPLTCIFFFILKKVRKGDVSHTHTLSVMSSVTVEGSVAAVGKTIFHASKFSTQAVFGLLVGKRLQSNHCFVVDAIPVTHTLPAVCPHPTVESALAMISSFVTAKGLVVLGLYVANERLDDNGISDYTTSIVRYLLTSNKVSSSAGLVLWQLQNPKLKSANSFGGSAPIVQHVYTSSASAATVVPLTFAQWDRDACATSAVDEARVLAAVKDGIHNFEHCKLVDFEEHLENVALDFFNESTVNISL